MYEQEELPILNDYEKLEAIDTASILKRLETKDDYNHVFKALNDYKISNIDFWEEYKYYLIAIPPSLGLLGMTVYAGFILKFLDLPTLQELAAINRGDLLKYANTTINSMNTTCGQLIPITKHICNNTFQLNLNEPCYLGSAYAEQADFLAEIYRDNYNNFPLANFCDWPKWGDLAYQCAVRVMQYASLSCLAPNQGYLAGLYVDVEALEKACGTMPNCSTPINNSAIVKSGSLALNICNAITKSISFFNTTFPGQNVNCADKFYSTEAYSTCYDAAPCQDYDGTNDWWSEFRILLVIATTVGLLLWLGTNVVTMVTTSSWIAKKRHPDNLSEDERKRVELLLPHHNINFPIDDSTQPEITDLIALVNQVGLRLKQDEELLADRYSTFLLGMQDSASYIPENLPKEVVQRLFYFSGLFASGPVELTPEDCEAKTRNNFQANR